MGKIELPSTLTVHSYIFGHTDKIKVILKFGDFEVKEWTFYEGDTEWQDLFYSMHSEENLDEFIAGKLSQLFIDL